jgi:hypothetical protein
MNKETKIFKINNDLYLEFEPERFNSFMLLTLNFTGDDLSHGRFIRLALTDDEAEALMLAIQQCLHQIKLAK